MQIQSINSTMQPEPAAWSISAPCIDASVSTAFYSVRLQVSDMGIIHVICFWDLELCLTWLSFYTNAPQVYFIHASFGTVSTSFQSVRLPVSRSSSM
jgi:hypothetical protein